MAEESGASGSAANHPHSQARSRNPLKPCAPTKRGSIKRKIFYAFANAVSAKLLVSQKERSINLPPKRGSVKLQNFDNFVDEVSAKLCVSKKPASQSSPDIPAEQSSPFPYFGIQAERKEQEESGGLQQPYLERQDLDSNASVQVPKGCHNVESLPTCNQEDNSETEPLSLSNSWSPFPRATPEESTMVKELGTEIAESFAERPFGRSVVGDEMNKIKSRQTIHGSEVGLNEQDKIKTNLEVPEEVVLLDKRYMDFIHYCSVFPSNYGFTRDVLVWSWIAMGMIKAGKNERMEEVGFQCFDKLLTLGYFLPMGYDQSSEQIRYTLGDSMNLFHQTRFHRQQFGRDSDNELTDMLEFQHWSWVSEDTDQTNIENLKKCDDLKTLLLLCCRGPEVKNLPRDLFLELKVLRIMDLSNTDIVELPSSVGNIKSLRYLDISQTPIRRLPESIDQLTNLQTLRLVDCPSLNRLPRRMNQLINLRHLVLDASLNSKLMLIGIGKLTNLQTLKIFAVRKANGFCIGELKHMNNLNGPLCISNLETIWNKEEAMEAALCNKQYLKKLELQWSDLQDAKAPMVEKEILECLQPHYGLKELKLLSYVGLEFPSWVSNPSFANMVSITIYRCRYCINLPCFGELPSLEYLSIIEMNAVRHIDSFFCRTQGNQCCQAFPKLKRLTIDVMLNLENWSGVESGDFPSLVQLTVKYCQNLTSLPLLTHMISLEYLEISYCQELSRLPEKILPASLETLMVKDCPKLRARCCKDRGEEWSKVSHVPVIYFDHQKISTN